MRAIISVIPGLSPRVNAFLKILADRNHLFLLPAISKKFHFFLEKSKKIIHVRFQIAGAFPKHFGFELFALLQKITKTDQIILKASYEPKLLGGSIFEYNSLALDKSILKEFGDFFKEN
jgi:F0F1-type ATP synthase delta subunit